MNPSGRGGEGAVVVVDGNRWCIWTTRMDGVEVQTSIARRIADTPGSPLAL
jgi:hypothetical protein